jgi:hypothetical protein
MPGNEDATTDLPVPVGGDNAILLSYRNASANGEETTRNESADESGESGGSISALSDGTDHSDLICVFCGDVAVEGHTLRDCSHTACLSCVWNACRLPLSAATNGYVPGAACGACGSKIKQPPKMVDNNFLVRAELQALVFGAMMIASREARKKYIAEQKLLARNSKFFHAEYGFRTDLNKFPSHFTYRSDGRNYYGFMYLDLKSIPVPNENVTENDEVLNIQYEDGTGEANIINDEHEYCLLRLTAGKNYEPNNVVEKIAGCNVRNFFQTSNFANLRSSEDDIFVLDTLLFGSLGESAWMPKIICFQSEHTTRKHLESATANELEGKRKLEDDDDDDDVSLLDDSLQNFAL